MREWLGLVVRHNEKSHNHQLHKLLTKKQINTFPLEISAHNNLQHFASIPCLDLACFYPGCEPSVVRAGGGVRVAATSFANGLGQSRSLCLMTLVTNQN